MKATIVDRLISGVLAMAAVVMAGVLLHRELHETSTIATVDAPVAPEFVANWKALLEDGIEIGSRTAPIHIVEFMDLECPFCRRLDRTERFIRKRYGSEVAITFVHFPLSSHRFAKPAALAAECARQQGRFDEYVQEVYEKQDSLGLKTWKSFAADAKVTDSEAFERCVSTQAPLDVVERGSAAGRRLGVRGTPTIVVNGWRFQSPPDSAELLRAVATILDGKPLGTVGYHR